MEAVPRMPMLSFELKQSLEFVEFGPTLKQYIRDHYGEDPAHYNKACTELEQLRQSGVHVSHDFMGCSTLKKYFAQLQFLQGRFPMSEMGEAAIPFTWEDVYSGREVTVSDIKFEQACILYNIGSLHSILGAMDTRQSADGMKVSCTHFQCAAWAYEHLRDQYGCGGLSLDMSHELLTFQSYIMLAQAQECILEKSMTDSRKSTITAKVSAQIVEFYQTALRHLETCNSQELISSKQNKDWKKRADLKILFYTCITNYYLGRQTEDQQKWGLSLAHYTVCLNKLNECQKLAKNESQDIQESLKFMNDVVVGKHTASKKDNDFVYHDKVPALDSLPEVKGASLVKGLPFNASDPEISGPDIFMKLVPMSAHEAASMYSEEKASLLRRIASEIAERDEELTKYMASLQLDTTKLKSEPERLPQQLLEKCAALSVRPNAIKDLVDSMSAVSSVSTEVDLGIKEIQQLLQDESGAELEYQETFGKRQPNAILSEVAKECARLEEGHKKGSQSNTDLHKAMNTHISNLKLLSSPLEDLQGLLPSLEKDKDPESEDVIKQLNALLEKIDEMKTQRENLESQLRKDILDDDITGVLCKQEGLNKETLFSQQLQKHEKMTSLIRQNLSAQANILRAMTDANAKYAKVRQATGETIMRRDQMIKDLINSYDVYEDLMAKSQKGLEFYKKLETNVGRLLARCKGVIKVQQEEREKMVNRYKPKGPAPTRPAAAKPSTPVSMATIPGDPQGLPGVVASTAVPPVAGSASMTGMFDGPKLKDYLPFMKPKTFGKKDGSPPISAAHPSVQDYLNQDAGGRSLPNSGTVSPVHLPQMPGSVPASPDHFRHKLQARLGPGMQTGGQTGPDLTQGHPQYPSLPATPDGSSQGQIPEGYQRPGGRGQDSPMQSLDTSLGGHPGPMPSVAQFTQHQLDMQKGQGQITQPAPQQVQGPSATFPTTQYVPLDQKWKKDSPASYVSQPVTSMRHFTPGSSPAPTPRGQGRGQSLSGSSREDSMSPITSVGPASLMQSQFIGQPGQQASSYQQLPPSQPQLGQGHQGQHVTPSVSQVPAPREVTNTVSAVGTPVFSPGDGHHTHAMHDPGMTGQGHFHGQGQLQGYLQGQFPVSSAPQLAAQSMISAVQSVSCSGQQQYLAQNTSLAGPKAGQIPPAQSQSAQYQQHVQQQQQLQHQQQTQQQQQQPQHQTPWQQSQQNIQPAVQYQQSKLPDQFTNKPVGLPQQPGQVAVSQSIHQQQQQQFNTSVRGQIPMSSAGPQGSHQVIQQNLQYPHVGSPAVQNVVPAHGVLPQSSMNFNQGQIPTTVMQQPGANPALQQLPQQQLAQNQQQQLPHQQLPQGQPPSLPQHQTLPGRPTVQTNLQHGQQFEPQQFQGVQPRYPSPAHSPLPAASSYQPTMSQYASGQPGASSMMSSVPASQAHVGLPPQHQQQFQSSVPQSQPVHQLQQNQMRFQQPSHPQQTFPQQPIQQQTLPQQPVQQQTLPQQPVQQQTFPQQPVSQQTFPQQPVQQQTFPQQPVSQQTLPQQPVPQQPLPQQPVQQQTFPIPAQQQRFPSQPQFHQTGQTLSQQQQPLQHIQPQSGLPVSRFGAPAPGSVPQPFPSTQSMSHQSQTSVSQFSQAGPGQNPEFLQSQFQKPQSQCLPGMNSQNQVNLQQKQMPGVQGQNYGQVPPQGKVQTLQGHGGFQQPYPGQGQVPQSQPQQYQALPQQQPHPPPQQLPQHPPQQIQMGNNQIHPQGQLPAVPPAASTASMQQWSQPGQNVPSQQTMPHVNTSTSQIGYQQGHTQIQHFSQGQPAVVQGQGHMGSPLHQGVKPGTQIPPQNTYPPQQHLPPTQQSLGPTTFPQSHGHEPSQASFSAPVLQPQVLQPTSVAPVVPAPPPQPKVKVQPADDGHGQGQPGVTASAQFPLPAQPPVTGGRGPGFEEVNSPITAEKGFVPETTKPVVGDTPSIDPQVPVTMVTSAMPSHPITAGRQLSTASSLDEILSSSPDARVQQTDRVLAPKVLTAQEIQQQKEDQLKNSSATSLVPPKDPYKEQRKLDKFVQEVEKLAKFIEGLEKPSCSGPTPLDMAWKEIMEEQETACRKQKLAIARCYPMKNRDQDVMPYDDSRVLLTTLSDDYVNASWVNDLSPLCPKFIATQAPLSTTLVDFWLMIYEQGVEVLVMLSSENETGKKFPVYIPVEKGEIVEHGPIQLTVQSVKQKLCWTERILHLKHSETKTGRTLVHLHYNSWPVSGFPEKTSHVLQFITEVHSFYRQQRSLLKPIVVHCSNGVGRTGMFLMTYVGMQVVNHGDGIINVTDVAGNMLWKRRNLLLRKDQLKFCYEALLYFAQDVLAKQGILVHKASFGDQLPKPGVKSQSWEPGEDILFGSMSLSNLQTNIAKMASKKSDSAKLDKKLEMLKNDMNASNGDSNSDTELTGMLSDPDGNEKTDEDPKSDVISDTSPTDENVVLGSSLPDVVQGPGLMQEIIKDPLSDLQSDMNMLSGLGSPQKVKSEGHKGDRDKGDLEQEKLPGSKGSSSSLTNIESTKADKWKPLSLNNSPAHQSREGTASPQFGKTSERSMSLAELQDPNTFTIGIGTKTRKITKVDFTEERQVQQPDPDDPLGTLDPFWSLK